MTTSFWSKEELSKQFAHCGTVRDVIAFLESDFSKRGEVICEIRINGMLIEDADEKEFADNPAGGIEDLAVKSDKPGDLIGAALLSAAALVPTLDAAATATAEKFRGAQATSAHASFIELLDGCQWLIDTLVHVRGAASGLGQPVEQAERWVAAESLTTQVVKEVSAAFASSDLVLVADLVEYELTGALGVWKEALAAEIARRG